MTMITRERSGLSEAKVKTRSTISPSTSLCWASASATAKLKVHQLALKLAARQGGNVGERRRILGHCNGRIPRTGPQKESTAVHGNVYTRIDTLMVEA